MSRLFTSPITFHQIQLLFWSLLGTFNYAIWVNSAHGPSVIQLLIKYGLGFMLSYLLHMVYAKLLTTSIAKQMTMTVAAALPLAILWQVMVNFINITLLEASDETLSFDTLIHNSPSSYLLLLSWSVGYWLVNYYQQFIYQQNQLRQVELEANQAQLKMLRFQLNPHFLFNVLSTIDTLIMRKDLEASRRVLERISDYLRETLLGGERESQSLDMEINLLTLYIAIEQERFGERLLFTPTITTDISAVSVPRHVLQPLAENAIKHGIAKLPSGGEITLDVSKENQFIVIKLSNPMLVSEQTNKGFNVGLKNVQQRLNTFFNQQVKLNFDKTDSQFCITLYLPITSEK